MVVLTVDLAMWFSITLYQEAPKFPGAPCYNTGHTVKHIIGSRSGSTTSSPELKGQHFQVV